MAASPHPTASLLFVGRQIFDWSFIHSHSGDPQTTLKNTVEFPLDLITFLDYCFEDISVGDASHDVFNFIIIAIPAIVPLD